MKNNIKKAVRSITINLVAILCAAATFLGELVITNDYNFYSMFHEFIDLFDGMPCCTVMIAVAIGVYELAKHFMYSYRIVNVNKNIICEIEGFEAT